MIEGGAKKDVDLKKKAPKNAQKVMPESWTLSVTNTFLMPDFRHALTLQHPKDKPVGVLSPIGV